MADAIGAFERDFKGATRNVATLDNVVGELFGKATNDPRAAAFAKAWTEASEYLRQRFNAAGGAIAKRENWGLPQYHDAIAVAKTKVDDWIAYVTPRLDRKAMTDLDTGLPMDDGKLNAVLREVYTTITTRGWSKVDPSGQPMGRALSNARIESRVLQFRTGADWLDYQKRFGQGDAFAAMMGHLDEMARDIAQLEVLGPNPGATMRYLEQRAKKAAAEAGDGTGAQSVSGQTDLAHRMLGLFDGSLNVPVNPRFATVAAATREFLVSAQLGAASLSSVTDIKTQRIARRISGIRSNAVIGDLLKTLNPRDPETRRVAVRSGLIADGAAHIGGAYARYAGEINASGFTRWLADTQMRWSGLAPMTQAHKWAFGMEFMGQAADYAGKGIKSLEKGDEAERAFARTLADYQLTDQWDAIRAVKPYEPQNGAKFIRAEEIARDVSDAAALRWSEMIDGRTKIAVPEAFLRARATLAVGKPGDIGGEIIRSVGTYKSYPLAVSMILHHLSMEQAMRAGGGLNGAQTAAMFLAQVIAGLTVYGAVAMQLKEVSKGRDPRDMNPLSKEGRTFWAQAALQGGGLGIFGDFLTGATSRGGQNFEQTVAGSPIGFVADAAALTVGNAAEIAAGEDAKVGRESVNFARHYTPLANTWWMSQGYQRGVLDNLQRLADPDADAYFRRQRRDRVRRYGNGYYWGPGETIPARPPALEAAIGAEPGS